MQFKESVETNFEAKFHQLKDKNQQLEEKVIRLESKVQQLESANALRGNIKSVDSLTGRSAISRTCREARLADPSLDSGMHWIDPDGQGVGDYPIYVHCDMTTGTIPVHWGNVLKQLFVSYSVPLKRYDIRSTRQRRTDGRWPLRWSGMLLKGRDVQRKSQTDDSVGRFVQRMPSVD